MTGYEVKTKRQTSDITDCIVDMAITGAPRGDIEAEVCARMAEAYQMRVQNNKLTREINRLRSEIAALRGTETSSGEKALLEENRKLRAVIADLQKALHDVAGESAVKPSHAANKNGGDAGIGAEKRPDRVGFSGLDKRLLCGIVLRRLD